MKPAFLQRDIPKRALAMVLALAAVAGVVAGREKPALEVVRERSAPRVDPGIDLAKLGRAEAGLPDADPFAQRGFGAQPKREAAAPQAPQPPSAPPLPFQYIGKVIENGKLEVYVTHGEELPGLTRGQKIGNEYRVDKITTSSITFTYLPLKLKQTLDLPAVN
jgi:hypothetical protein